MQVDEVHTGLLPFVCTGEISNTAQTNTSNVSNVSVLRDTGATANLLYRGKLPKNSVPTGESIVIRGIAQQLMNVPVYKLFIKSEFITGSIDFGVIPHKPQPGVDIIIGNKSGTELSLNLNCIIPESNAKAFNVSKEHKVISDTVLDISVSEPVVQCNTVVDNSKILNMSSPCVTPKVQKSKNKVCVKHNFDLSDTFLCNDFLCTDDFNMKSVNQSENNDVEVCVKYDFDLSDTFLCNNFICPDNLNVESVNHDDSFEVKNEYEKSVCENSILNERSDFSRTFF